MIALSKITILSLQWPKTVLQFPHTKPRVFPVVWSWSMDNTFPKSEAVPVLQIAQTPFWSASIFSNCSRVRPYLFSLCRRIIVLYASGFFLRHAAQLAANFSRLASRQRFSTSSSCAVRGGLAGSSPAARLAFRYSRWRLRLSSMFLYGMNSK